MYTLVALLAKTDHFGLKIQTSGQTMTNFNPPLILSKHLPIWRMYTLVALLAKTDHFGLKIRIIWAHYDEF